MTDVESPIKFEAFVDDLSKHRIDTNKETLAVLLNNDFELINKNNTIKDNNIISPYPNFSAISRKLKKGSKNNDFILILNNFKSDKKYLKDIRNDFDSSIIMEIFDGLKVLELVDYPYVGTFSCANEELEYNVFLPKRKNLKLMMDSAKVIKSQCEDIVNHDKLNKIVHWEDSLISKETPNNLNPNRKDKKLNRIIVVGDIHGDYEHLITILRHAKLIDKKNNWIGKNSI
ncbi:hypothetical protein PIROE2DRAFT_63125 [Piromyces sp. E2]|nr:hypothetical protein PIROE2DRAFT_63125 [Piromyces sp. E2]|eukprot:OUM60461.1 hypothetical protein PIROE2DRAFT_63125 [Piromyces sp. E2]